MTKLNNSRENGPIMFPIKASAGSGKTHALTRHYLEHLAASASGYSAGGGNKAPCAKNWQFHPASFADIVAITFTNAAVEELRQRVLGALKKLALGLDAMDGMSAARASSCLDALLRDMGQMNVRTIDSLLYQIVRGAAPGLGLAADFQTVFSFEDAVADELEKFIMAAENGVEENRVLLREAMQCFLESPASKKGDGKKNLFFEETLLERMKHSLEAAFLNRADKFPAAAKCRAEILRLGSIVKSQARAVLDLVEEIKANLPAKKKLTIYSHAKKVLEAYANGDFDKIGSPYARYESVRDIFNDKDNIGSDLSQLEISYSELREAAIGLNFYTLYLRHAPMMELAGKMVDAYFENLREQALLPNGLMPQLATRALDEAEFGICDTLCRLGSRLSHFLIDEFQDTNIFHWRALKPLLLEALSRGGSFIWVGDIKQSIYMWNGASPELFDDIPKDPEFAAIVPKVEPVNLEYNRRSAAEIVEHNNRLFEGLANEAYTAEALHDFVPKSYRESKKGQNFAAAVKRVSHVFQGLRQGLPENADAGGYVNLVDLPAEDFLDNFVAELMAYLDERIGRGLAYRDVMVLVRSNDMASELAEKLATKSLNVVSENSLRLASQPLVEQCRAFLEFLDNPGNEVAFMTVISGSIFADHPVAAGLSQEDLQDFASAPRSSSLAMAFRKKYPEIWNSVFEPFYKKAKLLAPYDAVKEWLRRMGAEERFPEERVFLRSLLETLHTAEKEGVNSIAAFLEYWAENGESFMASMPDGIDAIRIITIHRAKGLAAPVVFALLPQNALSVGGNKGNGKNFDIVRHNGQSFFLAIKESDTEEAYYREYEKRIVESLDMLYVAFTRPRRELHIYTDDKNPEKNLVRILGRKADISWPCGAPAPLAEAPGRDLSEKQPESVELPSLEGEDVALPWITWLKVVPNKLFSETAATKRGTFLHFCLENLRLTGNLEADIENAWRFALAHAHFPVNEKQLESLKPGLKWLLDFEELREWLTCGWPEHPLLDSAGQPLRADLLVSLPACLLVLDYKTGLSQDSNDSSNVINRKHVDQVRAYMKCAKHGVASDLPVFGLLAYLDGHKFLLLEEDGTESLHTECPLDRVGNKK